MGFFYENHTQIPRAIFNSDINQAFIRLVIGGASLCLILYYDGIEFGARVFEADSGKFFVLLGSYILVSFVGTVITVEHFPKSHGVNRTRRVMSAVIDVCLTGLGLHLVDEYSLILFSVLISIIIGYGFRFGLFYLGLTVLVGISVIALLSQYSPFFIVNGYLCAGLLIGVVLVPTYAAFLLTKYQKVLVQLEETNQARSRFIANMSHELRTPIHAIMINAESLIESAPALNLKGGFVKPLRIISESSSHLKVLVDRVLDIASSESRAFNLSPASEIDLFSLVTSSVEIGTAVGRKKGLKIIYTVEPSVHRFIIGSKKEILEILINVLGNASKFTEQGHIAVHVKEESDVHKEIKNRTIKIEIIDTGCGMTSEQLKSAFEPFVLGDDGSSRRYEGTGIGLTITQQYLEAMGGSINISSQVGLGTTVVIHIPCEVINKEKSNQVGDFSRFTFMTNNPRDEITELGINIIPYDGVNSSLANFEESDCILIDSSLLESQTLTEMSAALRNSDVPVVMVGKSKSWAGRTNPEVRYAIKQIDASTLLDVSALCFGSTISKEDETRVASSMHTQKLLVVDDNENNLASAELVLRNAGHAVDSVTSGRAAISKLEQHTYDLVFIDMHMPEQNGVETLLSAREALSKELPPIVFLTADMTAQAEIDASAIGISGFLKKPITPAALRAAVDRYGAKSTSSGTHPSTQHIARSSAYPEIDDMLERGISKTEVASLVEKFAVDINQNFLQGAIMAAQDDHNRVRKVIHRMNGSAGAMHLSSLAEGFAELEATAEADICGRFLNSAIDLQILSDSLIKDMKNYVFDEN